MFIDYFILATKNLKHRGIRSWLTLLGIFIGVTAVVSLISLGNGLQMAVSSQFGVSQTELITIQASGAMAYGPPGGSAVTPLTNKELEAIKDVSSVKIAVKRMIESGKIEYNDKVNFGYITSVPHGEDRILVYDQLGKDAVDGRLLEDSDVGKIFVGYNYYVDKAGFEKELVAGKKILIQDKSFEVVGVLDKVGSFIFDNAIYMNEKDMDNLFNYGDRVDVIAAKPVDKNEMQKTKEDIEKVLRKVRNVKVGEENFEVSTPEAVMSTVNGVLGGIQAFIVIVASISIFIGAIGIVNTMTTSVLERKTDIGVMKSIGARNEDIFLQFFIEASLLGLVGGIVGAIFGTLIGVMGTMGINSFLGSELSPNIDIMLIGFTLLGSFLIGGLAGITPAMSAARQNPVDALKG